jgi:hypothetical protein
MAETMPRKRTKKPDATDKAVQFFLDRKTMKATADYAARGRRYRNLTEGELQDRFTESFKQWAFTLSPAGRAELDDCQSEYHLRGLDFPKSAEIDLAMDALIQRMNAAVEELKADPKRQRQVNRELAEDIIAELEEAQSDTAN